MSPSPTPLYSPDGPHDFIHNKVLVRDDVVSTDSYNFSRNAETNAENQVVLADVDHADKYATYIDELVAQYQLA